MIRAYRLEGPDNKENGLRLEQAFRVVADSGSANSAARDLQPTTHTKLRLFGNRVAATGRAGSVEEIAPTAVLLASDEGAYYIGATLNPNGGDVMV